VLLFAIAAFLVPDIQAHRTAFFAAAVVSALSGFSESGLAVLRASGRVAGFFLLRDIVAPLLILGLIAMMAPGTAAGAFEIYIFVWASVLIAIFGFLAYRAPSLLPAVRVRRNAWRKVTMHTLALVSGNLTSRVAAYIDVLAMTFVVSLDVLGEYRVVAQFAIGFMVVQHFLFLGLPWQLRHLGAPAQRHSGYASVVGRQRLTILLGFVGLCALSFGAEKILGLLGERFIEAAGIFRLLLVVRFADLLWGPQHEILVSRGLVMADAYANVTSVVLWCLIFPLAFTYLDQLHSAVVATAASTFCGQLYRYMTLRRGDIFRVFGHPFGLVLPGMVLATAILMSVSTGVP
jgi:hypothetical protein